MVFLGHMKHSISWSLWLVIFYAEFMLERNDRNLLLLFLYLFFTGIMVFYLGFFPF